MKIQLQRIVLILCLFFLLLECYAQTEQPDSLRYAKVVLKSGKQFVGEVVTLSDSIVVVNTDLGLITVARADTEELAVSNLPFDLPRFEPLKAVDTVFIPPNWYPDNYYLLPSALPVGDDVRYYQNTNLLLNRFVVGFENISLEIGGEVLSLLANEFPTVYVRPKISIGRDDSHLSLGGFVVTSNSEFAALPFVNYTFGQAENHLTIGVSLPVSDGENSNVLFQLGSNMKISKAVSFAAELLYFEGGLLFTGGLNFKSKKNYMFELGFVRPFSQDLNFALGVPIFSVIVPLR